MIHIRDVWVNWFEGEENGYNVCPFYEWRCDDRIEVLDQVVVVKVTEQLYDYIENRLEDLPEKLLADVYRKSYLRKNMSKVPLDYCFVATDGCGIIAVDTIGYKTPMRKSRLTPRQEQIIYDLLENERFEVYDLDRKYEPKEYHILSPSPEYMKGLTRRERQLKQLLFMALDQLLTSKNVAEVRYWYTEWNPSKYEEIQKLSLEEAWQRLFDEVKYGWTSRHHSLCEGLVKGQPFFEKLWEIENGQSVK